MPYSFLGKLPAVIKGHLVAMRVINHLLVNSQISSYTRLLLSPQKETFCGGLCKIPLINPFLNSVFLRVGTFVGKILKCASLRLGPSEIVSLLTTRPLLLGVMLPILTIKCLRKGACVGIQNYKPTYDSTLRRCSYFRKGSHEGETSRCSFIAKA